ncbi:MAG: nuclear transport factor 2 family protein [Armatimonadota bacterium]
MQDTIELKFDLLRRAYIAFNARNIDAALAIMASDISWPRAFKGGHVTGREEVRAYWTEQWSEIDPKVEPVEFAFSPDGAVVVTVHQVVKSLEGDVLADAQVKHTFQFAGDLILSMDVVAD